jgi:hypothetical protein
MLAFSHGSSRRSTRAAPTFRSSAAPDPEGQRGDPPRQRRDLVVRRSPRPRRRRCRRPRGADRPTRVRARPPLGQARGGDPARCCRADTDRRGRARSSHRRGREAETAAKAPATLRPRHGKHHSARTRRRGWRLDALVPRRHRGGEWASVWLSRTDAHRTSLSTGSFACGIQRTWCVAGG